MCGKASVASERLPEETNTVAIAHEEWSVAE